MKYKRIKIATALVVVGLIGGVIYNQVTVKKSYDYSDYYVETKTTKKEQIKRMRKLLKRSFLYLC